jgi:hypothetical protein
MAPMTDNEFVVHVEWLEAPGVTTPELAVSWARYEIWLGDTCLTQVETRDSTVRRSVYGSLYPLAEWITGNWWLLTSNIRPSALRSATWAWPKVARCDWLRNHNLRGAGDGMTWPNLALVPEGPITQVRWFADDSPLRSGLSFIGSGNRFVRGDVIAEGLTRIVESVLGRLSEQDQRKTRLAEDWQSLGAGHRQRRPGHRERRLAHLPHPLRTHGGRRAGVPPPGAGGVVAVAPLRAGVAAGRGVLLGHAEPGGGAGCAGEPGGPTPKARRWVAAPGATDAPIRGR